MQEHATGSRLSFDAPRAVLRPHRPEDVVHFLDWYADPFLAHLTRHDQSPLPADQIRVFFHDVVMPASARGECFGIALYPGDRLIGTCSLTDFTATGRATLRILIGPKECWNKGYGTSAVRQLMRHAFGRLGLNEVTLGVFDFNRRAIASYEHAGFRVVGTMPLAMPEGAPAAREVTMVLDLDRYRRLGGRTGP